MRQHEIVIRLRLPLLGKGHRLLLAAALLVGASAIAFAVLPQPPPNFVDQTILSAAPLNALSADVTSLDGRVSSLEAKVGAHYYSSTAQAFANGSSATVDFSTLDWDTMKSVTTGGQWSFVVPVAGRYIVNTTLDLGFPTILSANGNLFLDIYQNTTVVGHAVTSVPGGNNIGHISGFAAVNASVGDKISVVLSQGNGNNYSATLYPSGKTTNQVSIERMGP
jgi:hypothetical protein